MSETNPFMTEALAEAAEASRHHDVPVGAVVVKDGKIIGRGHNRREVDHDPSAHAEVIALRNAAESIGHWNLTGAELFVTLEPCPMCAGAIMLSRIKILHYGASDPKGGAISLGINILENEKLNHRVQLNKMETEESSQLLKSFFQKRREEKKQS